MEYLNSLQSGLKSLIEAGEAGRTQIDGVVSPINSAIDSVTGAASELEGIPFVGPVISAKLRRVTGAISAAQATVGKVLSTYSQATRAASMAQERFDQFGERFDRVKSAANRVTDQGEQPKEVVVPSAALATVKALPAEAVSPLPHLLILQPHDSKQQPYYFNLSTAAFEELRRSSQWRWAAQERLTRRPAKQGVGIGDETISLRGVVFPQFQKVGIGQLNKLRSVGDHMQPLGLVTGYGEALGNWCLKSVEEEQGALMSGGIPRKQSFTVEFERYGDDLQNI
jgi:phage protein U